MIFIYFYSYIPNYFAHEIEYLHPADDGEACEEPHGASNSRQLVHKLGCSVLQRIESNRRVMQGKVSRKERKRVLSSLALCGRQTTQHMLGETSYQRNQAHEWSSIIRQLIILQ